MHYEEERITIRCLNMHHVSRTKSTVARSSREAKLHGLSFGTTETMGVLQFLRECKAKTNGYVNMCTDATAGKSMASRLGVGRATKHALLRQLYAQDLVSTGVARWRNVPTKDNLLDLQTKGLPLERLRFLCGLHCLQSTTVDYNIHGFMQHDYHVRLAQHYRMNTLRDCIPTQFEKGSANY